MRLTAILFMSIFSVGQLFAADTDNGKKNGAIVVYPNSGEIYDVEDNSWHGSASVAKSAEESEMWLNAGAKLIGGCCRVGPQQIAVLFKTLQAQLD